MIPDKPFKTYTELLQILKSRNVIIPNDEQAIQILSTFSYYSLINGYKDLFPTVNDIFTVPIVIYDFYYLSFLDRNLNNIFFKYIIRTEKELKNHISYRISEKYGVTTDLHIPINTSSDDYLSKQHFKSTKSTNNILRKVKDDVLKSKNQSIIHYLNHHNHIPCWILVNGISLGVTIELYNILLSDDKSYVCDKMIKSSALAIDEKKEFLNKGIKILRKYRNNIAHGHRTFSNSIKEELPKRQVLLLSNGGITTTDYKNGIGKNDILAVILTINSILENEVKEIFLLEIKQAFQMVSKITFSTGQNIYEILSLPRDFISKLEMIIKK